MLTVNVVIPTWHYWHNPLKLQPLWELYYATFIETNCGPASVTVTDLREQAGRVPRFEIPESDVYFYWIMKSADSQEVEGIVRQLRSLYPSSRHIAGGNHIDRCIKESTKIFDACVIGTAEGLINWALSDLRKNKLQKIYESPAKYPFSDYGHAKRHFIPAHRIVNCEHFSEYGGFPGTGVYFSRGCSFKCSFCVYNNPEKFDLRTPLQIRQEIEYLKKEYQIQGLNLRDEVCIPLNKKEAVGYLEAIGSCNIKWRGQTSPTATEDLIKLASDSGCLELALGLENVVSNRVLTLSNKPSKDIDHNRRFVELVKKHGIRVKVCLIFGLPGEPEDIVDKTIQWLDEVQPNYVALSGLDPVPGSQFFTEREKYGIKHIDKDLSKHAHLMFRFGDQEEVGLPFEYEEMAPWGKAFRPHEIAKNIQAVQHYLRERRMTY